MWNFIKQVVLLKCIFVINRPKLCAIKSRERERERDTERERERKRETQRERQRNVVAHSIFH